MINALLPATVPTADEVEEPEEEDVVLDVEITPQETNEPEPSPSPTESVTEEPPEGDLPVTGGQLPTGLFIAAALLIAIGTMLVWSKLRGKTHSTIR